MCLLCICFHSGCIVFWNMWVMNQTSVTCIETKVSSKFQTDNFKHKIGDIFIDSQSVPWAKRFPLYSRIHFPYFVLKCQKSKNQISVPYEPVLAIRCHSPNLVASAASGGSINFVKFLWNFCEIIPLVLSLPLL